MEFSKTYDFGEPIHHVIFNSTYFAAIDNDTNIIFFDRSVEKLTTIQKFNNPIPYKYHKASCSSIDSRFICFYLKEKKNTYLLLYKEDKKKYILAKKLDWGSGLLECVVFDNNTKLFATGGNNGKVSVYSCNNGKLYASLPQKSDYIANLAFNKNGDLLAYSSFDKSISIYDLNMSKMRYTGNGQSNFVVMVLKFLNNSNKIVLADRDGKVVLYDFLKKKIIKSLISHPSWPMALYVDKNDEYILVAYKDGSVYLSSLLNNDIENIAIHKSKEVVLDIRLFEDNLCFIFENGVMTSINLKEFYKNFQKAYEDKDYTLCYELLSKNNILYYSDTKKKLDEAFDELLKEAIVALSLGNEDEAKKLIKPFTNEEKFNTKIKLYFGFAKKNLDFTKIIDSKEYEKAYALVDASDIYINFPAYKKLEEIFFNTFNTASGLLVKTNPDVLEARKLLMPFLKVPQKRNLINNLLDNPIIFKQAELLYQNRQYQSVAKLVEKNPMLKDAPFYKEFSDYSLNLEFFFELHMETQDFTEALKVATEIEKDFPELYAQMQDTISRLKIIIAFSNAVETKSFLAALRYILINDFLIDTPAYEKLSKYLNERFDKATEYARKSMLDEMNKLLTPLLKNKALENRTISIYKLFYIEQILNEEQELDNDKWQTIIKNYTECFGVDDEIKQIAIDNNIENILTDFKKEKHEEFTSTCVKAHIYKN